MEGFFLSLANLFGFVIFLLLAFVFRYNINAANLIAGYNTRSEDEKAKWNATEMCRFISSLCFFWTLFLLVSGIVIFLIRYACTLVWALLFGSWGILSVTLIFAIIHLNRSERFKV